jgi:DNA-binding transcriptional LysR family regulator
VRPDNRPLDLEWIEDFLALAESGHFSRAAEARLVAQPAFSRHIRALEECVGVDLVDRGAHPVELTEAGRKFLPLVRDAVASLEAARIKARLAQGDAAASLRFAVTHALSITFFPRWLRALETRLRPGPIQTLADHSRACEDLMTQRRVQFMLCYGHADVPTRLDEGRHPVITFRRRYARQAAPGRRRKACTRSADDPARGSQFCDTRVSAASCASRDLRRAGRAARGCPSFTAQRGSAEDDGARRSRGGLPLTLIADELASGALVPAGDERWHVPIEIRLYRQNAEMASTAEELWRVVGGSAKPE